MSHFKEKTKEYDSFLLAILNMTLHWYIEVTMMSVYRLFGLRKEKINLKHADVFLLTTTTLIIILIGLSQVWINLGWLLIILGNIRILQIVCLNINTLIFGSTPFNNEQEALKRTRWHLLALWFSFWDIILSFAFMYQFFDCQFKILNVHSKSFIDYFYCSMVTIATLGYGDFVPVTTLGRIFVIYQLFVALFFVTFVVSGAIGRFQRHA